MCSRCEASQNIGVGAGAPTWNSPTGFGAGSHLAAWASAIAPHALEGMPEIYDVVEANRLRQGVIVQIATALVTQWPGGPSQAIADIVATSKLFTPKGAKRFVIVNVDGRYARAALELLRTGAARKVMMASPTPSTGVAGRRPNIGVGCGCGGGNRRMTSSQRMALLDMMRRQGSVHRGGFVEEPNFTGSEPGEAGVGGRRDSTGVGCGCGAASVPYQFRMLNQQQRQTLRDRISAKYAGVAGRREGTGVGCACGQELGFAQDEIERLRRESGEL